MECYRVKGLLFTCFTFSFSRMLMIFICYGNGDLVISRLMLSQDSFQNIFLLTLAGLKNVARCTRDFEHYIDSNVSVPNEYNFFLNIINNLLML